MSSNTLEVGVLFSVIILLLYILGAHIIEIYKVKLIIDLNLNIDRFCT